MEKIVWYGKERLAQALAEEILKPEEAKKYFACRRDEKVQVCKKAAKSLDKWWEYVAR